MDSNPFPKRSGGALLSELGTIAGAAAHGAAHDGVAPAVAVARQLFRPDSLCVEHKDISAIVTLSGAALSLLRYGDGESGLPHPWRLRRLSRRGVGRLASVENEGCAALYGVPPMMAELGLTAPPTAWTRTKQAQDRPAGIALE